MAFPRSISARTDSKTCASCGGYGIIVHHRSYAPEVLRGEADELLATVCEACHHNIHFKPDGTKRVESEWDSALEAGLRDASIPEPKVDLRRRGMPHPPEWDQMTAKQRNLYSKRWQLLWYEKRIAKGETNLIGIVEKMKAAGRL